MKTLISILFLTLSFACLAQQSSETLESGKTKLLIYDCDFSEQSDLDDWQMEGPGIAKITDGRLELYSKYQKKTNRKMMKGKYIFQESGDKWYQNYVQKIVKKKDREQYILNGTFRGGHLVYWNKTISPENFVLEFEFQSKVKFPLHMIMFSARGKNGENVFDKNLKKRNGLAAQYTKGDIYNYRISFFAPDRKTANMRKCPGRRLVCKGIDKSIDNKFAKHKMKVVKWKDKIEFWTDGELVFEYTDKEKDEFLSAGQTAIRLMVPARGYYDNYKIYKLRE